MATITPKANVDAEAVAAVLRKAMKGFGTDEKTIIKELTSISNAQRQEVALKFKTVYGRDLIDDLKSELGGKLEMGVLALMQTPEEYDARSLRGAMKGAGTDEAVISEILASRSNAQLQTIKAKYNELFKRDLEKDIKSETSGNLERIYVSLMTGGREESDHVDRVKAENDAKALFDAGEKRWGTDESEFNRVFMTSSKAQLAAVCEEYRKISDYDLERALEKELSGDLEFAYLAVVRCSRDVPGFFAERAYRSMKGMGTDEQTLVRVLVSRSEIDLERVKASFMDKYSKSLAKWVKDDTGGDFEKLLLAVLREA